MLEYVRSFDIENSKLLLNLCPELIGRINHYRNSFRY
jgi:hypothetical protein